jgi:tight adherence protein C
MTATIQILTLLLIFFATVGLSWAVLAYFSRGPLQARLKQAMGASADQLGPTSGESPWREWVVAALAPAGKLSLPEGGWENSPLRHRFMHAGFRADSAPMVFFGSKTVLAVVLPLMFMLLTGLTSVPVHFNTTLVVLVGLAAAGYYLPNLYLRSRIAKRQLEIFETFPDAIDLMTISVEAGLGLDAAIARVSEEMSIKSDVLAEELKLVGLELRAGASRNQALHNLALRTGVDEVSLFVAMLVQADRFGTSMADSLRVHSDSLRTKRRLRAEEAAAKIPLKLLFPLIMCIFPSLMIVLMGPAVISIYRVFFPIATGG